MKAPSVKRVEKAIGVPSSKWPGNCYSIATKVVKAGIVTKGHAVYGHWLGPVAKGTLFDRGPSPFVQHGWVLLDDGNVLDPTRWVFEGKKPYIYVGPNDHYDEGGNRLRMAALGRPPEFDPSEELFDLDKRILPEPGAWSFIEKLLGLDRIYDEYDPGTVTRPQLFWLANLAPTKLAPHGKAIFKALDRLGMRGLIPIDNYRTVMGEFPGRGKKTA